MLDYSHVLSENKLGSDRIYSRIRIFMSCWIRIRVRFTDPDPDVNICTTILKEKKISSKLDRAILRLPYVYLNGFYEKNTNLLTGLDFQKL